LILWPRVRRLAVLNQAGLGATLPHLESLTARWEAGGEGVESPLWREADELSGYMLHSWPRGSRRDDDPDAGRMLDLQARLGNLMRIDTFLADSQPKASTHCQTTRRSCALPRCCRARAPARC
jgi:hypothetical protein